MTNFEAGSRNSSGLRLLGLDRFPDEEPSFFLSSFLLVFHRSFHMVQPGLIVRTTFSVPDDVNERACF